MPDIFQVLTLPVVENELAARRRDVAALVKIREALKRKASYENAERRIKQQRESCGEGVTDAR